MEWWLNISFNTPEDQLTLAQVAEECGFAGVTVADHLVWPSEISSAYPYAPGGAANWPTDADWPDPWVAIAALAQHTRRLKFGTSVFIAPLRDPIGLAKSISTACAFAPGRVVCGFGIGWMREEFDILRQDFDTRARRMEEMLHVMRALWTGDAVEHHGEFYDFPKLRMRPAPSAPPPIYLGGNAPLALARAARQDGWLGAHVSLETTAAALKTIEPALAASARSRADFHVMMAIGSHAALQDADGLEALGIDSVCPSVAIFAPKADLQGRIAAIRQWSKERNLLRS